MLRECGAPDRLNRPPHFKRTPSILKSKAPEFPGFQECAEAGDPVLHCRSCWPYSRLLQLQTQLDSAASCKQLVKMTRASSLWPQLAAAASLPSPRRCVYHRSKAYVFYLHCESAIIYFPPSSADWHVISQDARDGLHGFPAVGQHRS